MRWVHLTTVALLLASTNARAEDLEKARAYFQAGVEAYDEGRYEVALREFQHSHALSHNPELYFNMAACEEHENHFQAASLLLRQYLIEKPGADDRPKVEARIKVLEEREESIHRPTEPIIVHEKPVQQPVTPAPATKANYTGGYVGLGLTGAFAIGWIGAGAWAVTDHGSLASGCGKTPAGCTQSQIDSLHAGEIAADVFMGLTIAAAITTVVLFIYEAKHPRPIRAAQSQSPFLGWRF
jgi:hypothetical protein